MTYDFNALELVNDRGKTKIIRRKKPGVVHIKEKDDMTAANGKRHELIPAKGMCCAAVTARHYWLARQYGIPTAFLRRVEPGINEMAETLMYPYEVVVRMWADGSYCKRNQGVPRGTPFVEPVVEFYLKTSGKQFRGISLPEDDPIMVSFSEKGLIVAHPNATAEMIAAGETIFIPADLAHDSRGMPPFGKMAEIALKYAQVIVPAWGRLHCRIIDFKIEFGTMMMDGHREELVISDSNGPDELRLVDENGNHYDKQPFRDAPEVTPGLIEHMSRIYFATALLAEHLKC